MNVIRALRAGKPGVQGGEETRCCSTYCRSSAGGAPPALAAKELGVHNTPCQTRLARCGIFLRDSLLLVPLRALTKAALASFGGYSTSK